MSLFFGFDFCVQLVWIIVRRLCDVVYSYEREKMMFSIQFLFQHGANIVVYIFEYGQPQKNEY
jgi:hypothetical protein